MYAPEHVTAYYATLFAARTDVYSQWTPDGWRPVRADLTSEIISAALTGKSASVSGYLIAPGSTSHLFAVDFDRDDGLDLGFFLAQKMAEHGLPAYVETSRRGCHLWCLLDDVLPAVAIRASIRALLQAANMPDDPKIELRPGSDTISDDGLGHALRLPLMPHPATGRRGVLHHASGEAMTGSLADIILSMEWASAKAFVGWAERWHRPPLEHIPSDFHRPHQPFPEDNSKASDILRELWGVPNPVPGRAVKCPAHNDRHPSLNIFPDDKRVMCMTGSCILNNNDHGVGTYQLRKLAPHG